MKQTMQHSRCIKLDLPVDDAVTRVKEALQAQGFGTLTEIDVQRTLRAPLTFPRPQVQ